MLRILFVCAGNTCRSVIAEHIANQKFPSHFEATSAGMKPGSIGDTENAVFILERIGIHASGHKPRDVREMTLAKFDVIITMNNDVARELLRLYPHLPDDRLTKWRISDPYGHDLEEYVRCANAIHGELKKLLSSVERPQK